MMLARFLFALLVLGSTAMAERPGGVFMMIFPDARGTALGGCGAGSRDAATYYNPASLGFDRGIGLDWTHAHWLPGLYHEMSYDYVAARAGIIPRLGIGADFTYLQTGETDVIDEQNRLIARYRTFDLAAGVAAGYRLPWNLSVGAGVKGIYEFLYPTWVLDSLHLPGDGHGGAALTAAVDFGVQYRPADWAGLGMAVQNIGPGLRFGSDTVIDRLPAILRGGWELVPPVPGPVTVRIVGDAWRELVSEMNIRPGDGFIGLWDQLQKGIGVEVGAAEVASVRLGYFEDIQGGRGGLYIHSDSLGHRRVSLLRYVLQKKQLGLSAPEHMGFCFGAGVEYTGFRFDVGADDLIYDFLTSNIRLQVSARF